MNRKWWALAGACAGLFLLMLDSTVVALALPAIRHDVGASSEGLQWVMNGYLLTNRGAGGDRWAAGGHVRAQAGLPGRDGGLRGRLGRGAGDRAALLLLGYLLFGIALGLVYAPMSTAAMAAMPPQKAGIASGVLAMDRVPPPGWRCPPVPPAPP